MNRALNCLFYITQNKGITISCFLLFLIIREFVAKNKKQC